MNKYKIWIRYKKHMYKINLFDGFFVMRQTTWLFARRILRFCKRVRKRSWNILLVLLCAIVFSIFIIPIGLLLEEYNHWYEVFWDLRNFLLTSILIVFVTTNVNEERKRNDALKNQYYIYSSFTFETECYIEDLLGIVDKTYSNNIFLTNEMIDNFEAFLRDTKYIKSHEDHDSSEGNITYLLHIHQKYLYELKNLMNEINSLNNMEMNNNSARKLIKEAIVKVENEIMRIQFFSDSANIIDYLGKNLTGFHYIIAELRRPWRWDHERNMEIRARLIEEGESKDGIGTPIDYWFL